MKIIGIVVLIIFLFSLGISEEWRREAMDRVGEHTVFNYDSIGLNDADTSTAYLYRWYSSVSLWWKVIAAEQYLLMDGDIVGTPSNGDLVIGQTSSAMGLLQTATIWGDTAGILTLAEVDGAFSDGESLFVGTVYLGIANGTLGDVYLTYDNEDVGESFTVGTDSIYDIIGTAKGLLTGLQDDDNVGKLVIVAANSVAYADTDTIYGHSSHDTADVNTEARIDTVDAKVYAYISPSKDSLFALMDSITIDDNEMHVESITVPRLDFIQFIVISTASSSGFKFKLIGYFKNH